MNECRGHKELMHAALDGELPAQERRELMDHIAGCSECNAAWRRLSAAQGWLGRAQMAAPPTGFAARVRIRAEMRQQARRNRMGWLALVVGTLVVALLAGSVTLGWFRTSLDAAEAYTWIRYGPVAAQGLFGAVSAVVRGLWLFVRGVALYAHVNWMLICVAAMSLATGVALVASHLAEQAAAMRWQRSAVAIEKGV